MSILITGASGRLGKELVKIYSNSLSPKKILFNITQKEKVISYIKINQPKIIIHTAAITDIRQCEKYPKLAWNTNVEGTRNLLYALTFLKSPAFFIYISTACVFYGNSSHYTEKDIPYPKNFYSLTKLLGERTIIDSKVKNWLIIRTNFVPEAPWRYEYAFKDRYGTYLFSYDVAHALKELIESKKRGIVHICGSKKMSMYELAKLVSPDVKPMTIKDYKGPPLTMDMSLNTVRWKKYKIGEFKAI